MSICVYICNLSCSEGVGVLVRSEGGADCLKLQDVNGSDSEGMSGGKIGVGGGVTKVEDKSWATGMAL